MKTTSERRLVQLISPRVLFVAVLGSPVLGQVTERVSLDSGAGQVSSHSFRPSVSSDGRYVAFLSSAINLVPGDTNVFDDVFVRDRQNGSTERVSVGPLGVQGNQHSRYAAISADGRYVAFESTASNLVAGDTNAAQDIFVRDRVSGTTERVSVDSAGLQVSGAGEPSISADGRYVTFHSFASNLVPGDTNGTYDCFLRDRQTGTTERISLDSSGTQGNGPSEYPAISADGRYAAFVSGASNLVPGGPPLSAQIYVRDRQTGTTERVSLSTTGVPANFQCQGAQISADGRCVAFHTWASNLVPGDTLGYGDVFVRDRISATTDRVSIGLNGEEPNSGAGNGSMSADGRFVAFFSYATNLVAVDGDAADIFVRDRSSGTTERVSVDTAGGEPDGHSFDSRITADGRFVAFFSVATNLVPADTNASADIFLRDRGPGFNSTTFCSGDGSGTACPCGNNGALGNGCANSLSPGGAHLRASGNASLSNDSVVLSGTAMPDATALYFQGTTRQASGAGSVFGDGLRCAGGSVVRLLPKTNVNGASRYPGAGDPSVSVKGNVSTVGIRTYQVWYRNSAAFCTSNTFNLTNGVSLTWWP